MSLADGTAWEKEYGYKKPHKTIQQVKLYNKAGKALLLIENHNGAFGLKLLDESCTLKSGIRLKKDKSSFITFDELQKFEQEILDEI